MKNLFYKKSMKKHLILVVLFLLVSILINIQIASATTEVGGIMNQDTTWKLSDSPIIIKDTVQIPEGITLTIEPGVMIYADNGFYKYGNETFLLYGNLIANGTKEKMILFEGANQLIGGSYDAKIIFNYCRLKNNYNISLRIKNFGITNSYIEGTGNLGLFSSDNINLKSNIFVNLNELNVSHSSTGNIEVHNNLFIRSYNNDNYLSYHWGSEDSSRVYYHNSFINYDSNLFRGSGDLTDNYWGTVIADEIGDMVYDKLDRIDQEGIIKYEPFLLEPHPDTPTIQQANQLSEYILGGTDIVELSKENYFQKSKSPYIIKKSITVQSGQSIKVDKGVAMYLEFGTDICFFNSSDCLKGNYLYKNGLGGWIIEFLEPVDILIQEGDHSLSYKIHEILNPSLVWSGKKNLPVNISNYNTDQYSVIIRSYHDKNWGHKLTMNINQTIEDENNLVTKVDVELSNRLKGKILLQVEDNGEGWYVNPDDKKKYYLGRPADAFDIMRSLGLGISENSFNSFSGYGPANLSGKILLRVEANGEAYYVNPIDLKMHYLGRPADAFNVMRELGLGITNTDIRKIDVGEL